ncbi:hypothetical protein N7486_005331 [Penicillium sp. IBT 16267x]|nr:hypothetical protein N7486_005331 [Penicillium sp. IBT 16267x]
MAIASLSLFTTRRDKAKEKDKENELREALAAASQSIREKNWQEAEECCRSVVNKTQPLKGKDSPETIQAIEQLASIYDIQQKLTMMEESYRTLVRRGRRSLGPTNADTLKNHEKLAEALFRQDKWSQAEVTLKEILDLMGGVPADGPGDINIRRVLGNLAQAVENQMHWTEAEILYRQLVRMTGLAVNQNRTLYYQCISRLAGVLCSQGGKEHLEEAVSLYEEVHKYHQRVRGDNSLTTARSKAELDKAQKRLAQQGT